MALMIVGLVLFLGIHSLRIVSPDLRERAMTRMGKGPYRGLYSLASIVAFLLMIWGFARASSFPDIVYVPPSWLHPVTEALMLPALVLAVASVLPGGWLKHWVRHPLLIGTIAFAVAHLFVNGDLPGVILFGAFFAWAVVDLFAASGRAGVVATPAPSAVWDFVAVVAGLALYGLLVWRLHAWLFGVSPIA